MSEEFKTPDPIPEEWYDNKYWETVIRGSSGEKEECEQPAWNNVAQFYILTEDFIREFVKEFDKWNCWTELSTDQNLSEKFIEEFKDKVDWVCICAHQHLSVSFVEKYSGEVNWPNVFRYQEFDDETRKMLSKTYHHKLVPREPRIKRWNDVEPESE